MLRRRPTPAAPLPHRWGCSFSSPRRSACGHRQAAELGITGLHRRRDGVVSNASTAPCPAPGGPEPLSHSSGPGSNSGPRLAALPGHRLTLPMPSWRRPGPLRKCVSAPGGGCGPHPVSQFILRHGRRKLPPGRRSPSPKILSRPSRCWRRNHKSRDSPLGISLGGVFCFFPELD